ncbi:LOW QUALITY PROTEIN: hypothetical protein U9M48_040890 [Paspalum notatum var. saurae]|uniref:Gag-pol polyprotein n=1 Tax=Paspalum notatum var. saurae TaxID=547442 RepID=A0AAQ3UMU8_PASNO
MKVMLKARGLWRVVQDGTDDEQEDQMSMKAILKGVPPEYVTTLGSKDSAKEAWTSLEAIRVDSDRVKKAKLRREFETISFHDGEAVEDFALRLTPLVSQLGTLGEVIKEETVVAKYLRVVPSRYAHVAIAIETMLDLDALSIKDVTGRLKAVEDRVDAPTAQGEGPKGQLLLTEEEWTARMKEKQRGDAGSSLSRGRGRRRGKSRRKAGASEPKEEGGKAAAKDKCLNCGKFGHWARNCHAPRRREQANLAQEEEEKPALLLAHGCSTEVEAGEPALLMAQACAVNSEAEEAKHAPVRLEEPRAQVHLGKEEGDEEATERWYLDSGASNHMTGSLGRGTILFSCSNGGHRALTGGYYIPRLRSNIVSLGQLDERGCKVLIDDGVLRIRDREQKLLVKVSRSKNRLYVMKLTIARPVCLAARHEEAAWRWHARFGHLSFDALGRMARKGMVRGLPEIEHVSELCDSCLAGKQRRAPFPKTANYRAQDPLELVHGDLCGPIKPAMHGGRRYFLLLVDDSSCFMWLWLLTAKDQAAEAIKEIKARAEMETGKKLKALRTDRGGEFNSEEFAHYCAGEGVGHHLTAPYSPQQNGIIERRNQTVVGMARSMLKAKGMPAAFWGEAVSTTVYILNRSPTKSLENKTPFEAWHGRKPDVAHLRTFGCVGHVKVTRPNLAKLEDKSKPMIFLGYEAGSKAYQLYDPVERRVHVSRDVVFDEAASWDWARPSNEEAATGGSSSIFTVEHEECLDGKALAHGQPEHSVDNGDGEQGGGSPVPGPGEASPATPAGAPIRYATPPPDASQFLDAEYEGEPVRFRIVNDIVGNPTPPGLAAWALDDELHFSSAEEPPSFAAAEQDENWRQAMLEEMSSIQENQTWELVDPPANCRPIGLKWVYKVKRDERGKVVRHKARLVARGFMQREGIDFEEVFAPVARMESVRLVLALAATRGWNVHHMDVKSALLNGELKEEVFIKQPPGFVVTGQEHRVLRLRKALYGLRQAPRAWNLGFAKCETEHALYTRRAERGQLVVGVYVNDLVVTGTSEQDIVAFKEEMKKLFRMSDLGLLTYYLGIEVEQGTDSITLRQSAYARKLLERRGMAGCRANKTPMEEKIKLSKASTAAKVDATGYRSIVGGLRYLVHTRPDLAFAVGYVSRFMEDPREDHLTAVKHLLRYVVGTLDYGIVYPRRGGGKAELIGYSDSDMGGDVDGRKSTSGLIFFLGKCPISWQSQKQRIVALSTCEAEYIAAATACCQGVWLRRLLQEITGEDHRAPVLRMNNKSAIELAKNPVLHDRSKHIDIRFHFIRDCVNGGRIVLGHVETGQQLADILTKPLGQKRLVQLMVKIGVEEKQA